MRSAVRVRTIYGTDPTLISDLFWDTVQGPRALPMGMGCMRRLTKIGDGRCDWVLLNAPQLLVCQLALYDLSGMVAHPSESETNRHPLKDASLLLRFPGTVVSWSGDMSHRPRFKIRTVASCRW